MIQEDKRRPCCEGSGETQFRIIFRCDATRRDATRRDEFAIRLSSSLSRRFFFFFSLSLARRALLTSQTSTRFLDERRNCCVARGDNAAGLFSGSRRLICIPRDDRCPHNLNSLPLCELPSSRVFHPSSLPSPSSRRPCALAPALLFHSNST